MHRLVVNQSWGPASSVFAPRFRPATLRLKRGPLEHFSMRDNYSNVHAREGFKPRKSIGALSLVESADKQDSPNHGRSEL